MKLVFILVGTDALNHRPSGFPVEIISASVGSVVAFIVLVTFLFFMRRFWCKKENSKPVSEVSQVICNYSSRLNFVCSGASFSKAPVATGSEKLIFVCLVYIHDGDINSFEIKTTKISGNETE